VRPETVRRLAHEAITHLEYINTHVSARENDDMIKVFDLCDHIDALEAILHRMIGC
jgi:hypothetical protein